MARPHPERAHTLGSLLRLPYQTLQEAVYAAMTERGFDDVRMAHSAVFRHIDPGGTRMTTLAVRAGMTKQSMAYLVDSLAGSGYLETVPDPRDRRAKLVRLTSRGERAVQALLQLSAEFERQLAQALGSESMAQLRALLERVAGVLQDGPVPRLAG